MKIGYSYNNRAFHILNPKCEVGYSLVSALSQSGFVYNRHVLAGSFNVLLENPHRKVTEDTRYLETTGSFSDARHMYVISNPDTLTFYFVRNPWSRLVDVYHMFLSDFQHLETSNGHWGLKAMHHWQTDLGYVSKCFFGTSPVSSKEFTFEAFLEMTEWTPHVLWRPQSASWFDVDNIGLICKYENILDDYDKLIDYIGMSTEEAVLPQPKRPSFKGHYSEYYTPELREYVCNTYRSDIECFEYEFDSV